MSENCQVCNKPASFNCASCNLPLYCSKNHQKEHWNDHKSACRPFSVIETEDLGRCLVATRDINTGDIIISEDCLVVGPKICKENYFDMIPCVGCYTPMSAEDPISRCSSCGWPACSPNCSGLFDSNMHAIDCLVLRLRNEFSMNNMNDFYRTEALTPLKCLLLQKKDPKMFESLLKLESHIEKREENIENFNEIEERIVDYLIENFIYPLNSETAEDIINDVSNELLHQICGIIETNGLEIRVNNLVDLVALYPTACLIEHNCVPNTYHSFNMSPENQFRIIVKAAVPIKTGEHITSAYTHPLWATPTRLENLYKTKFFHCKCNRCKDPTELGTYLSALKCLNCGGTQVPHQPLDTNTDWACTNCSKTLNNEKVSDLVRQLGDTIDHVQNSNPGVNELNSLLEKMLMYLHPNHFHIFGIKHSLVQLYGYQNGYLMNQLSDKQIDNKIQMCQELIGISQKIDPGLFRLNVYTAVVLRELHLAKKHLLQHKLSELNSKEAKEENDKCLDYLENALKILKDEIEGSSGWDLKELILRTKKEFEIWQKHNQIYP